VGTAKMAKDILGKITKVTTPIVYKDPTPFLVKNLQKSLAKKGVSANVIKKATIKFEEHIKTDHSNKAFMIGYLGDALLSHSAQKVYLVDLGEKLTEDIFSGVPEYLKSRIIWTDKNKKITNTVGKMLTPIAQEIEPSWKRMQEKNAKKYSGINSHEHGLCLINEFLVTMSVATRYNTEADLDLNILCKAIKRVRHQVKSNESLALLSRIEGVANCYQISRRIPNLAASGQPTPKDLLKDLLDDGRMISLSKSRYLLGIPSKFEIGLLRVKRKVKELLSDRRNREYIVAATKLGNMAAKHFNIEILEIGVEQKNVYAPPLISLDSVKPNCLSTNRELPTVFPT
jgi:hypothetical protein